MELAQDRVCGISIIELLGSGIKLVTNNELMYQVTCSHSTERRSNVFVSGLSAHLYFL